MLKFLTLVPALLVTVGAVVHVAEDALGPGTGEQKKAAVIEQLVTDLPGVFAALGVPSPFAGLLVNEAVLGFLVDLVVRAANQAGQFVNSAA